ncbi:MAG: SapC family protein [Roseococcus sp.]|nr:SapC family protein [Roseococcus sp.]
MTLPPLYAALEPLSAARHGRLCWRDPGLAFAVPQPLPLALDEIGRAARHAPVVFAPDPPHAPFLLWPGPRPGAHVPRYLRRYPFLLAPVAPGREELALCVDPGAPHLSETEGEPLFDAAGRPTPLAARAFAFARALEEGLFAARAFAAGLARWGLLAPAALPAENTRGIPRPEAFRAVHREAFMRLSGDQLAMLRDKGWLEPLVAHLLSVLALEG